MHREIEASHAAAARMLAWHIQKLQLCEVSLSLVSGDAASAGRCSGGQGEAELPLRQNSERGRTRERMAKKKAKVSLKQT